MRGYALGHARLRPWSYCYLLVCYEIQFAFPALFYIHFVWKFFLARRVKGPLQKDLRSLYPYHKQLAVAFYFDVVAVDWTDILYLLLLPEENSHHVTDSDLVLQKEMTADADTDLNILADEYFFVLRDSFDSSIHQRKVFAVLLPPAACMTAPVVE